MTDAPNQPAPRWRTWLPPVLIVFVALGYYGSYLQFWFNPHDEGGTAAFMAMRLLAGEVPLRDVELGYNVLWFWPIVGLFKVAGVNFLLMRGYFFALSIITALCGWALVRRVTRNEWLALAAGLALVVFPGSQFKNYNALLCVANTLCLVQAALVAGHPAPFFWRRVAVGGLVLGLTFLVRIDIGFLVAPLWAGLLFLRLFQCGLTPRARWIDSATAGAILLAGIIVTHAPVLAVARTQGFERAFLRQYPAWLEEIGERAGLIASAPPPRAAAGVPKKKLRPKTLAPVSRATLPRMDWETFASFKDTDKSVLFLLTYWPIAVYLPLIGWAGVSVFGALRRRDFALDQPAALALLLLGGSLTTFAQFFFFRPDRPHLSEFMPGYFVATVCVAMLLARKPARFLLGAVLALQFALFGYVALDHYSAGTIAARTRIKPNKRVLFEGANGVRVWVHKKDHAQLEGVRRAVVEHAKPGEWVVCYPYQPGFNLMTDRPTYERALYMDNAIATRDWPRKAIARMEENRPAVIVIDERAINRGEFSRFSRWAMPVYEWVRANYHHSGTFGEVEVYARDPLPETTNL